MAEVESKPKVGMHSEPNQHGLPSPKMTTQNFCARNQANQTPKTPNRGALLLMRQGRALASVIFLRSGQVVNFVKVGPPSNGVMEAGRNGRVCNHFRTVDPMAYRVELARLLPCKPRPNEERDSGLAARGPFSLAEMRYLLRGCGEWASGGGKDDEAARRGEGLGGGCAGPQGMLRCDI